MSTCSSMVRLVARAPWPTSFLGWRGGRMLQECAEFAGVQRIDARLLDAIDGVLLLGLTAGEEQPTPQRHRRRDDPGQQAAETPRQSVSSGEVVEDGASECVLRRRPRLGRLVVRAFEPSIGVGNLVAVEVFDEVEAMGLGVLQLSRPTCRTPAPRAAARRGADRQPSLGGTRPSRDAHPGWRGTTLRALRRRRRRARRRPR